MITKPGPSKHHGTDQPGRITAPAFYLLTSLTSRSNRARQVVMRSAGNDVWGSRAMMIGTRTKRCRGRLVIKPTSRDQFGNRQVVNFQAQSGASASAFVVQPNEAILRPGRQSGVFLADSVGVIAKGLVKRRAIPRWNGRLPGFLNFNWFEDY